MAKNHCEGMTASAPTCTHVKMHSCAQRANNRRLDDMSAQDEGELENGVDTAGGNVILVHQSWCPPHMPQLVSRFL